ncbi:MAG: AraC family transcriptional regulator [Acutalibacteraceae bacterium]|nr:AraC family transcriptional regulator [Acutalibacteraceae bacterium]
MKFYDEGKAKLQNVDLSMQCIFMSVGESKEFGEMAHYHEYIELLYGIDCDIEVWINGNIYPFKTGDLIIINSMEAHQLKFLMNKNDYIVIKFSPQQLYTSEQSVYEIKYLLPFTLNDFSSDRRISADVIKDTTVPDSIRTIYSEWEEKSYGYELAIRTHIFQIILWLLRYWNKTNPELLTNINLPPILAKALGFISLNLSNVTASDVANFCGYSYTYFSEIFKNSMHVNFRDYLLRARINEAEKLLLTTDTDITDIALSTGFSTASHFIKQFKTVKGTTPTKFRIQAKKLQDT